MSNQREQWTAAILKKQLAANKYGAKKKQVDGFTFDSVKESNRYVELKLRQQAGEITELQVQPEYPLLVTARGTSNPYDRTCVGTYRADFRYREGPQGLLVIEDVKCAATKTAVYKLKKRIVETYYGVQITEV
jgi:hypothetical protein